MTKIVFDTDSLIKLTKAGLKEIIVNSFEVVIPYKVKEESVDEAEGKPDGIIIERNILKNKIKVVVAEKDNKHVEKEILDLNLNGGERDVYRLTTQKYDLISSDDQKFLRLMHFLSIKAVTPATIIILLFRKKKISKENAHIFLMNLQPYISREEYELCSNELIGG